MIYKIIAFFGTFFAYASLHSIRTGWSFSQPQLTDEQGVTTEYFGMVDTLYLICYAVGMGTLGNFLIGRLPLNYFIGLGMIFAALSYMSFSFYFLSTQVLSYPLITIFMCLNGLFQSTGIPGVTAVMGNWFSKGRRGLLMGFWAINGNIGNIIGSVICNVIQYNWQLPWTYNFIFTGCFTILVGLIVILFLKGKPTDDERLHEREDEITDELIPDERGNGSQIQSQIQSQEDEKSPGAKKINVFTALLLPMVPFYVIGYALVKGCIIGLLFWLPTYLHHQGLDQQKGYISSMVDVGSFVGGLIMGSLGDKYKFRALFISPFLLCSSLMMFLVAFAFKDAAWMYYLGMLVIGFGAGGTHNIVGSAIVMDLGEQVSKDAIGKISALCEGFGAIFSALSQFIIAIIPMEWIFYCFAGECIISTLVFLPMFLKDYKNLTTR